MSLYYNCGQWLRSRAPRALQLIKKLVAGAGDDTGGGPEVIRQYTGMPLPGCRQNVEKCRILVTVPACLEILLLSPSAQERVRNIRYVILDEVSLGSPRPAESLTGPAPLVNPPEEPLNYLCLASGADARAALRYVVQRDKLHQDRMSHGSETAALSIDLHYVEVLPNAWRWHA